MAVKKRGPGRPRTPGKYPLDKPQHELFCLTYTKNGFKRGPAYQTAYGTENVRQAEKYATRLLQHPDIQARLRYLVRDQDKHRVLLSCRQYQPPPFHQKYAPSELTPA